MQIISKSVAKTLKIGKTIAKRLERGDIICLFGQLGSGKTVLIKGIASGLGLKRDAIISPSFVLLNQYTKGRLPLYHFDLYRLKSAKEILDLGYEEYFYGDGVTVIEWADRLKFLEPKESLKIKLSVRLEQKRLLEFIPVGRHYQELLKKYDEDIRH